MDYTGTIKDMYRGMDGKFTISLSIEEEPGDIEALTDKRLRIKITEYKQKRSLNANAFFHLMCDKLRMKMHPPMSMAQMKNHLIADYGQVMYLEDGVPLIYKTNAPPEYVYNLEEPHLLLVKTTEENGKEVYFYRMYRGSHTYNTKEMSQLISGTVEECKQQGIETMTSAELERMLSAWQPKSEI